MSNRSPWPFAIVGLLGLNMAVVGVTVFYATSDRSLAIEPNYYQKALAWDRTRIQDTRNTQLGWTLTLKSDRTDSNNALLSVELRDKGGSSIDDANIEVIAFHNSRAAERSTTLLASRGEGRYVGTMPADRDGVWHYRVTIHHGTDLFTDEFERSLTTADSGEVP